MWKLHKYIQLKNSPLTSSEMKKHQQASQTLELDPFLKFSLRAYCSFCFCVADFQTPQNRLDLQVPVYAMHAHFHKSFVIFYFFPSLHFIMTDDYFPHVKPLIKWNVRCSQTSLFFSQMFAFHKSNKRRSERNSI